MRHLKILVAIMLIGLMTVLGGSVAIRNPQGMRTSR